MMRIDRSIQRKSAAVLLGFSALVAMNACSKSDDVSAAETTKTEAMVVGPENITIATNGAIMTGPSISGTLEPERAAVLRAQVPGSVLQTYADQGQAVNAGAVLARIDASGIQDAYTSARAGLVSARNAADVAAKDLARNQKLLAAGAIAERDIDQSRRVSIAAQAALSDANSRLASAEKAYRSTTVTSPFSGVVSERPVSPGDVVQPGTALFTVVDPSSMRLEASVPAEQRAQIRIGVPVNFHGQCYPGRQFWTHHSHSTRRLIRLLVRCASTSPFQRGRALAAGCSPTDGCRARPRWGGRSGVCCRCASQRAVGHAHPPGRSRRFRSYRPHRQELRDDRSAVRPASRRYAPSRSGAGLTPGTRVRISSRTESGANSTKGADVWSFQIC